MSSSVLNWFRKRRQKRKERKQSTSSRRRQASTSSRVSTSKQYDVSTTLRMDETPAEYADLQARLDEFNRYQGATLPQDVLDRVAGDIGELARTNLVANCLKTGDYAPNFCLPDGAGRLVELQHLLATGPVVLSFYRGNWCNYCKLQLKALHSAYPTIRNAGGTLVAVSPQNLEETLTTFEENSNILDVLSDLNNVVARHFRITFFLTDELIEIYRDFFKIDLERYYGNARGEIPAPATYVIQPDGKIVWSFVDANFTKRASIGELIKAVKKIKRRGNKTYNTPTWQLPVNTPQAPGSNGDDTKQAGPPANFINFPMEYNPNLRPYPFEQVARGPGAPGQIPTLPEGYPDVPEGFPALPAGFPELPAGFPPPQDQKQSATNMLTQMLNTMSMPSEEDEGLAPGPGARPTGFENDQWDFELMNDNYTQRLQEAAVQRKRQEMMHEQHLQQQPNYGPDSP